VSRPKNFEDAIDKLEDKAHEVASDVGSSTPAADALGSLETEFKKIWSSLQGLSGNVKPGAQRAKEGAEETVTQNPWVSLAAVGLLAFIIGYVLGGRRSE
jgi:ElaB/YqjD/DUF883 family membrane-anchored ribosome-binding protein